MATDNLLLMLQAPRYIYKLATGNDYHKLSYVGVILGDKKSLQYNV